MADQFYICDMRPEWRRKPFITFWRPNDAGYAFPLAWAGKYTRDEVILGGSYYYTTEDGALIRCPVAVKFADALGISPPPGVIDGDAGPVVKNTAANRRKLAQAAFDNGANHVR